jgi:hypothetical protein
MQVLIHIGQSKTGTSAIQSFLTLNRKTLREHNILYPAVSINGMQIDLGSHNAVADALAGKSSFPYLTASEYFSQFFDEARRTDANLMILSAEHFFAGEPRVWNFNDSDEYFKRYEEKLASLAKFMQGHEVSVLVYLRPQTDWFYSAVGQNVRTDRLMSDKQLYKNDRQFFGLLKPIMRYATMLGYWERVINPVAMIVVPYIRERLHRQSSVSDFLMRVGLEHISFPYANVDIRVNESLTREYLEVKKILNCSSRTKNTERVIINCLERLSRESSEGTRCDIDKDVAREIEEFVSPENELLNSRYGKGEIVFSAQALRDGQVPLSDEVVRVAMQEFRREYRRPYYRVMWLNYAARDLLRRYARPVHAALHQLKMFLHKKRFQN